MTEPIHIESHHFLDDGGTPNHPVLCLLVMRGTGAANAADPAAWFERRFTRNGWGATWRWQVYPYQHYHSTNHEVLGVSRGESRLLLGGDEGVEFHVGVGDVIVLPAGVGHKCLEASGDFQVVGAYPGGDTPDILRPGEGDPAEVRRNISRVPVPDMDPVYGNDGPLVRYWKT
jgi:uncharacterized protein YjlB